MASRTRQYIGTLNNPTDEDMLHIFDAPKEWFTWAIFASECGENGTHHIQAAWQLKNAKTFSAMQKALGGRWHLEERKSSQFSAWAYCAKGQQSKEEWESEGVDGENWGGPEMADYELPTGHLGGIVRIIGDLPPQGDGNEKNVWNRIREAIENGWSDLEIVAKWPHEGIRCQSAISQYRLMWEREHMGWRDLEVTYITGNTGDGKTRYVMEKYGYNNVFRVQNYGTSGTFDNYRGQDVIVFEEFRSSIGIEDMLNYLDGYPCELPARYAAKLAKFTKVYIISNWQLQEQYQGIQMKHQSTWQALLRRIDTYGMIEGGQLEEVVDVLEHLKGQILSS